MKAKYTTFLAMLILAAGRAGATQPESLTASSLEMVSFGKSGSKLDLVIPSSESRVSVTGSSYAAKVLVKVFFEKSGEKEEFEIRTENATVGKLSKGEVLTGSIQYPADVLIVKTCDASKCWVMVDATYKANGTTMHALVTAF